jgi:hypothetical protein
MRVSLAQDQQVQAPFSEKLFFYISEGTCHQVASITTDSSTHLVSVPVVAGSEYLMQEMYCYKFPVRVVF